MAIAREDVGEHLQNVHIAPEQVGAWRFTREGSVAIAGVTEGCTAVYLSRCAGL